MIITEGAEETEDTEIITNYELGNEVRRSQLQKLTTEHTKNTE